MVFILQFVYMVIMLIDLHILKNTYLPEINPTDHGDPFNVFLDSVCSILLRTFVSIFINDIGL